MATCEGNSDERIGESLIKVVMEEQLKEVPSEDVPSFTSLVQEMKTEQEKNIVTQLAIMVRVVGDNMKGNPTFQDAIDGMAKSPGPVSEKFKQLVSMVITKGKITWEVIAVLFYVAGRLAVKMVEAHFPQCVMDILKCTLNYFRDTLLSWVREHGGWINSFSELARVPMRRMSSVSSQTTGVVLIFMAGLILGSIITWKLTRNS